MGSASNRELLIARWTALVHDPSLRDLPYKVELNREGTIEMSPASNWHAATQAYLAWALKDALPQGVVFTECSVLTEIGVRVPDVAWASQAFVKEHGTNTPFSQAPEICIEIASPSNARKELDAKIIAFLAAGAKEVWIVGPGGNPACFGPDGEREHSTYGLTLELPVDLRYLSDTPTGF